MTSPGANGWHDQNRLLLRFCTAVHQSADSPGLIKIVAGDADFVRVCRQLTSPPTPAFEIRFVALCNQSGFDAATIRRRVATIARALRLGPRSEAPADYYAILGVPVHADEKAIKRAFREKAKIVHPDRQTANGDAFLELTTAYHHLSDARLRRRYDDERRDSGNWIEPAKNPPRRPVAYTGPFGMIGALLAALVTAAFLFDLFYNETAFFSGPEPAATTLASVEPGPRLAAQPSPARSDHAGQGEEAATTRQPHRLPMSSPTPVPTEPAATPVDGQGSPTTAAAQHLVPMMEPTPVPEIVLRQTAAAPGTHPQPLAAEKRTAWEPSRSAAPSGSQAGARTSVPVASAAAPATHRSASSTPVQTEPAATRVDGQGSPAKAAAQHLAPMMKPTPVPALVLRQTTAAPGPHPQPLETRLQLFLNRYCQGYASRDLENFVTFFTPDATEQGQPFAAMLPAYRETFSRIQSVDYRIRIQAFTPHPQTGRVHVDGLFQAHYELKNGGAGDSSGTVCMDLAEMDEGFRVCNLEYFHN